MSCRYLRAKSSRYVLNVSICSFICAPSYRIKRPPHVARSCAARRGPWSVGMRPARGRPPPIRAARPHARALPVRQAHTTKTGGGGGNRAYIALLLPHDVPGATAKRHGAWSRLDTRSFARSRRRGQAVVVSDGRQCHSLARTKRSGIISGCARKADAPYTEYAGRARRRTWTMRCSTALSSGCGRRWRTSIRL
jgi:hypothetical protein